MKQSLLIALIVFGLGQQNVHAADVAEQNSDNAGGFGLGSLLGGLLAGPPGIVVGAAIGSAFDHNNNQSASIDELQRQLKGKDAELALIAKQLTAMSIEHENALRRVTVKKQQQSHTFLSENIALSIFFRTDQATIEPAFSELIAKLAAIIKDKPDIKVSINAHTDQRGAETYNLKLSESRGNTVVAALLTEGIEQNRIQLHAFGETQADAKEDLDGYAFERRVDIELSLHEEV